MDLGLDIAVKGVALLIIWVLTQGLVMRQRKGQHVGKPDCGASLAALTPYGEGIADRNGSSLVAAGDRASAPCFAV